MTRTQGDSDLTRMQGDSDGDSDDSDARSRLQPAVTRTQGSAGGWQGWAAPPARPLLRAAEGSRPGRPPVPEGRGRPAASSRQPGLLAGPGLLLRAAVRRRGPGRHCSAKAAAEPRWRPLTRASADPLCCLGGSGCGDNPDGRACGLAVGVRTVRWLGAIRPDLWPRNSHGALCMVAQNGPASADLPGKPVDSTTLVTHAC